MKMFKLRVSLSVLYIRLRLILLTDTYMAYTNAFIIFTEKGLSILRVPMTGECDKEISLFVIS